MTVRKKLLKRVAAIVLGLSLAIAPEALTMAKTSDQVALSAGKPGAGYVTSKSGLNVRDKASINGKVLTTLACDTKMLIVGRESNGWYKIRYNNAGNTGYVSGDYVREYDLDYYCTVNTADGSTLNFRTGTNTSSSKICSISDKTSLPDLLPKIGNWDYVVWGVRDGYVNNSYVKLRAY